MEQVHQSHEEWLKENNDLPVLELDGNLDFESDNKILSAFMNAIDEFSVKLVKVNLEDEIEL